MADTRQRLSADEQERSSLEKNINTIEHVEKSAGGALAEEILNRYPLLVGKSEVELALLNKKVLRKLDWRFLPCITAMLLMNYLDRINVSNARLAGMQDDLNMTDVQWSAGISLFYVGYIISQVREFDRDATDIPNFALISTFNSAGSRERHHCQRQASLADACLYACLVRCHYLDAWHEERLVIHALPLPSWRHRGSFPPGGISYDQFMVHERRVSAPHGYLARW
jgi:hypothetical protein